MAGPIYARYVPKTKKPEVTAQSTHKAESHSHNASESVHPSRRPLVARYVPSRPTEAAKSRAGNGENPAPVTAGREIHQSHKTKETSDEKERDRDDVSSDEEESSTSTDTDITESELESDTQSEGSSQVKQPKRPKKRKASDDDGIGLDDGSHLKKHKAVLSKFERSSKISDAVRQAEEVKHDQLVETDPIELHDIVPLPQPAPASKVEYKPTFSALPPWIANPDVVQASDRVAFSSLPIHPKLLKQIQNRGYQDAFAVQAALIPLLLPGRSHHFGDVCVSAATGSGKTLGYILPMVQSLRGSVIPKLRGLVVVPTRELVTQAKEVAELCATGTSLKVGTALGSQALSVEQTALINRTQRYDPEAYEALQDLGRKELDSEGPRNEQFLDDCSATLQHHVLAFESNVDILICTPGRLVDHIKSTRGFSLRDIQWLVIDEADRLLDQSFQDWADTLLTAIHTQEPGHEPSPRERLIQQLGYPKETKNLTKVILSATMTQDLAKLSLLQLRSPKMLVVQNKESPDYPYGDVDVEMREVEVNTSETFHIPHTLREFAMPVGDGSEKALVLLHLLRTSIMLPSDKGVSKQPREVISHTSGDLESPESDSESDTSLSDSSSSVSTDSSNDDNISSSVPHPPQSKSIAAHGSKVLIFTKDSENASRLSHLLAMLEPSYADVIGTLTKSSATSAGRKTLATFRSGKTTILIASDRASRGLDVPDLTHVVNYDIPRSITAYVHRVGRTARAGEDGEAWTLFTDSEGKWFWNAIARAPEIRRGGRKVQRLRPEANAVTKDMRSAYEGALTKLRLVVEGNASEDIR